MSRASRYADVGTVSHIKIETWRRRRRLMADEYYTD